MGPVTSTRPRRPSATQRSIEEGKARYEAKLAGKKYIPRASTPPDAKETESRRTRLDVASQVGKSTLVPAGAGVGKRGRGAGFYCEACDLTFKDNLQLVEHLNSRQHLLAIGRLRKKEEEKELEVVDLGARLEARQEAEDREREEKRRLRNEKRRKTRDGVGIKEEDMGDGVIR
ncbi:hypothetical protein MRB53_037109 [Persea americana]|nr:hypothetical protein MRB53_037109 [Persea americana]